MQLNGLLDDYDGKCRRYESLSYFKFVVKIFSVKAVALLPTSESASASASTWKM